eukprot:7370008-Prymnesium_polylepis.1
MSPKGHTSLAQTKHAPRVLKCATVPPRAGALAKRLRGSTIPLGSAALVAAGYLCVTGGSAAGSGRARSCWPCVMYW